MNTKKQLLGKVSSVKMDKTVVVEVHRKFPHPIYKKYVNRSKKYYADDPEKICNVGDIVRILESKPISKLKRWKIVNIEKKAVK